VFNLRGRIFMGDGGSVPLGFLAASLGLEGWRRGLWPVWFCPLVFAPFLVDATVTLMRRAMRGEKFWLAHREHYYQRLVRSGWTHLRLACAESALMLACGGAALAARAGDTHARIAAFATIAAIFLGAMLMIDQRWRRHLATQSTPR
jgi:UDP-N-acetylmuramyl pentapeptide phosphotransferase/UDP-N-acetylglucosamine-1-phosphate transferase